MTMHIVTSGEALLRIDGAERAHLGPGDVALVRPQLDHELVRRHGAPVRTLAELEAFRIFGTDEFDVPDHATTPSDDLGTDVLCGSYRLDTQICAMLFTNLPDVVHVRAMDGATTLELRSVIDLMSDEIRFDRPGRNTVLDRLLDVVVLFVLRSWFDSSGGAAPTWYRAMSDVDVRRALELMHTEPSRKWTIDTLAREVGVSRATLARRFTHLVGTPPSTYLRDWRMQLAAQQIRDGNRSLRTIARSVGYGSEFAFSAAFRRQIGSTPSQYRTGS
jgi:AraC-like DNA-binding protein